MATQASCTSQQVNNKIPIKFSESQEKGQTSPGAGSQKVSCYTLPPAQSYYPTLNPMTKSLPIHFSYQEPEPEPRKSFPLVSFGDVTFHYFEREDDNRPVNSKPGLPRSSQNYSSAKTKFIPKSKTNDLDDF